MERFRTNRNFQRRIEESPDGKYTLKIDEIGTPDFSFGNSHLEITLFEMLPEDERPGLYYRASFKADVANDGARGEYEIEWLDDGVQIILSGEEQPTAYYILPYKTLEESQQNQESGKGLLHA